MLNRIAQVLLTYVTRPAFWVLGALYVVGVIVVANWDFSHGAPKQSVAPGPPQSMRTLNLTDVESIQKFDAGTFDRNMRAVTIFWHNEIAEGSKPVRVWPDGRREEITYPPFSSRHLRQLKECRRLRTLTLQYRGSLTDDEWQALGELDQITALKYDGAVSPFGMMQIARLHKLHFLDLSGCTFEEGLEGLESLEHLQTLVLDNFVENRVHVLGQLRRLAHLRILVATHYREAGSNMSRAAWKSDLGDIKAVTGLELWFVDEHSTGFPGFDALARELPGIAIRPVQVDLVRQVKSIPVNLLTGILIYQLLLQLCSQFAHPAARLTPGYAVPHLIPATVLWLCSVLVPVCLMASAAIPILPLMGMSMAIWLGVGSLILVVDLLSRTQRVIPERRRWIAILVQMMGAFGVFIVAVWVPLVMRAMQHNQSSFDWFLRGHEPGLAIVMIMGGGIGYVLFARKLCRMHVELEDAGMGTPPLGLNSGQRGAWMTQSFWRQQQSGVARASWWSRLDRRLARVIDRAGQPGWRRRSNLWIAGNAMNGKLSMLICLNMCIGFGIASLVPEIWKGMDFELSEVFTNILSTPSVMLLMMFPDFCFVHLGIIWRGRRRLLAVESLRPVSRRQLVREMMTAFAWDCTPPACLYGAVVLALTYLAVPEEWSPIWSVALATYLVAHTAAACGAISWLNTIRRGWAAAIAGILIGYLFLFAGAGSSMMFLQALGIGMLPPDLPNLSHGLLLGIGVAWGLVALAIIASAFRRWMNVELGDYAV
ncbi:MAG: hypothetical protein ACKV0T_12620 [Planctomycetales bacterium]